jgi:hypothetical protein
MLLPSSVLRNFSTIVYKARITQCDDRIRAGNRCSNSDNSKDCFISHHVRTEKDVHHASYLTDIGDHFPVRKSEKGMRVNSLLHITWSLQCVKLHSRSPVLLK